MTNLIITFAERRFHISLFDGLDLISATHFYDAAENMTTYIQKILNVSQLSIHDIQKIGFLVGPGSFTCIRLCISVILAMQYAYPQKIYFPFKLEEAFSMHQIPIVVKCTHSLYHVFIKEWQLMAESQIYDVAKCYTADTDLCFQIKHYPLMHHEIHLNIAGLLCNTKCSRPIKAFYGFSIQKP